MAKGKAAAESKQTAAEVYAELASQGVGVTPPSVAAENDTAEVARADQMNLALRQQIADLQAELEAKSGKRVLDPNDPRLDEPVMIKAPRSKIEKGEENMVHTYRELGVHPDDLDEGIVLNPETNQIVKCKFIKQPSGNFIEMP